MHYVDTVTICDSTEWFCHGQYQCHGVILVTDTTTVILQVQPARP